MRIGRFLRDKCIFIILGMFLCIYLKVLLDVMHINIQAITLTVISVAFIFILSLFIEYRRKSKYYNDLLKTLSEMDEKVYISQVMENSYFVEAEILQDVLQTCTKAMNDKIAAQEIVQREYKEYIEAWIHEIKLPISCINLICENNKNSITKSIFEENERIDFFVEQALYYARSSVVEKDFSVRTIKLDTAVKSLLKKHSRQLITAKAKLSLVNMEYTVYADPKWLDFIILQIISNSIKYRCVPFELSFSANETTGHVILKISDNGIGISKQDLPYVFDKSFTGANGREFAKSTGIGLYLAKKLCEKMHLQIDISSVYGEGTEVSIIFPKDKRLLFE